MTDAITRFYAPPLDLVRLTTDAPVVFELAGQLWEECPDGAAPTARAARAPIDIEVEVEIEEARHSPRGVAFTGPSHSFEENLQWVHEPAEFRCEVPGVLSVRIDLRRARVETRVDARILSSPSLFPSEKSPSSSSRRSFLARTLLEAPAAVLLARRGWQVLHAGAVVGPRGAAVVRGASGAGKSTLVAAAHGAGLGVLGDESLLVSRADPDALAASVRDLAVREDTARLLGVLEGTEPAFTGREEKRRVDLFAGSTPSDRAARRVAVVLLGARDPGPASLRPLPRDEFLAAFRAGEIPQERGPGDPDAVARIWAARGAFELEGASDLAGAVGILKRLVT